jgi:hypothetical protein
VGRIQEGEAARLISNAVHAFAGEPVEFPQETFRIPMENPPGNDDPEYARTIGRRMEEVNPGAECAEVPGDLSPVVGSHGDGPLQAGWMGSRKIDEDGPTDFCIVFTDTRHETRITAFSKEQEGICSKFPV